MADWYLLLTPFLVLAVLALVRYVGCDKVIGLDEVPYPPDPPTGLTAEYGDERLRLSCNAVAGATGYRVKVREPLSSTWSDGGGGAGPSVDVLLPYGQRRIFGMVALNQDAESSRSNELDLTGSRSVVTAVTFGSSANYYEGWLGMEIQVGASPLRVVALGRAADYTVNPADPSTVKTTLALDHQIKIVESNGVDVPGSVVTVGPQTGFLQDKFRYGTLAAPVTLSANTNYFIVARETQNGDNWVEPYDTMVSTESEAAVLAGVYSAEPPPSTPPPYTPAIIGAGRSYGPVDILYHL